MPLHCERQCTGPERRKPKRPVTWHRFPNRSQSEDLDRHLVARPLVVDQVQKKKEHRHQKLPLGSLLLLFVLVGQGVQVCGDDVVGGQEKEEGDEKPWEYLVIGGALVAHHRRSRAVLECVDLRTLKMQRVHSQAAKLHQPVRHSK